MRLMLVLVCALLAMVAALGQPIRGMGLFLGLGRSVTDAAFNELTDYDWYVDSSVASSGDGTTAATAFKTPEEAASACSSGDTIAFKRGETYRGLFSPGAKDNLTLLAYGSGTLPEITAFDVHTGSWALLGGTSNVWQTSVTPEVDVSPDRKCVARKNGTPMELRASAAAVDSSPPVNDNPGGYHAPDLDGTTGTYTVSIYATADPGSDGATYEIAVRNAAINVSGDNWTIQNLRVVGGMGKDGPLNGTGDNLTCEDCVIEDGRSHNAVVGSGVFRRCDILHGENAVANSGHMITFFRSTVTTQTGTVEDCLFLLKFDPSDGYNRTSANCLNHHTGDATRYSAITVSGCKVLWMTGGFNIGGADTWTLSNTIVARLALSSGSAPTCYNLVGNADDITMEYSRAYGSEAGYLALPMDVDGTPTTNPIAVNHCLFIGGTANVHAIQDRDLTKTYTRCLVHNGSFHLIGDGNLGVTDVSLDACILDGSSQTAIRFKQVTSSLTASDNNQVDNNALDWEYGGTAHATFAAHQANGFDANGVAADPNYSESYASAAEPIASWTPSGDRGPDTSLFDDYTESIDAATLLAAVLAK